MTYRTRTKGTPRQVGTKFKLRESLQKLRIGLPTLKKMPTTVQKHISMTLKSNALVRYGYRVSNPRDKRWKALDKAVKKENATKIYRRLNLIYVWQKNKNPEIARRAKVDAWHIGRTYGVKQDGFSFQGDD